MSRRLTQLNEVPHQNNLSDTDFQSGPAQQSSPPDKLRLPPGTYPHVSTKALWVQPGVTRGPTSRSPIGCALTGFMLQRAKWTTQCACRAGENPHPQSHARALRRHVRLIPAQGLWLSHLTQHGLFGTHDQWHGNGKTHVVIASPGTRAFPSTAQLRRNRSQGPQSHP